MIELAGRTTLSAPHFIGIGAPRCGTTWVFKLLRLHPEVWMPWKEIHFFDSVDADTESGYRIQDRGFRFRTGWPYALRRIAAGAVPGARALTRRYFPLRAVQAPGLSWTARYFLGEASLRWYEDLFREGVRAGLKCGEITPAYFMLSSRGISDFAGALPQVRVFLLLRDPVEWAWSDLCKRVRASGRSPSDLSNEELIARCAVPTGRSRADFGSNLERWLHGFPRDRLLIGFHDEIRTDPEAFLDRLCAFIGVEPFPARLRGLLKAQVNSSARGAPMPAAVARYAAEQYRGESAAMARLLGASDVRAPEPRRYAASQGSP
jgi:Sulfotransferase family